METTASMPPGLALVRRIFRPGEYQKRSPARILNPWEIHHVSTRTLSTRHAGSPYPYAGLAVCLCHPGTAIGAGVCWRGEALSSLRPGIATVKIDVGPQYSFFVFAQLTFSGCPSGVMKGCALVAMYGVQSTWWSTYW